MLWRERASPCVANLCVCVCESCKRHLCICGFESCKRAPVVNGVWRGHWCRRGRAEAAVPVPHVPQRGDLIALDAEFVSINKEEAEIRSSGHKATIKPAHMACARISAVYGSGPLAGRTLFDDYIKISEPVRAGDPGGMAVVLTAAAARGNHRVGPYLTLRPSLGYGAGG